MIEVKVKSTWQGKVGIRDKYALSALRKGEGLRVTYRDEVMEIPANEIERAIVGRSEKPFTDRFGKDSHYLFYFKWMPDFSQPRLIFETT